MARLVLNPEHSGSFLPFHLVSVSFHLPVVFLAGLYLPSAFLSWVGGCFLVLNEGDNGFLLRWYITFPFVVRLGPGLTRVLVVVLSLTDGGYMEFLPFSRGLVPTMLKKWELVILSFASMFVLLFHGVTTLI